MPTPERYTRTAVWLHWMIAILILINVTLGLSVGYIAEDNVRAVINLHKSIGILVLGLVILRILWRATHEPPALSAPHARWELMIAKMTHGVLYVLILALPLSGWMHDSAWKEAATHPLTLFGIVPWPRIAAIANLDPASKLYWHDWFGTLHVWCTYALYGVLALHIGGALKHQYFDQHSDPQRGMLPARRVKG